MAFEAPATAAVMPSAPVEVAAPPPPKPIPGMALQANEKIGWTSGVTTIRVPVPANGKPVTLTGDHIAAAISSNAAAKHAIITGLSVNSTGDNKHGIRNPTGVDVGINFTVGDVKAGTDAHMLHGGKLKSFGAIVPSAAFPEMHTKVRVNGDLCPLTDDELESAADIAHRWNGVHHRDLDMGVTNFGIKDVCIPMQIPGENGVMKNHPLAVAAEANASALNARALQTHARPDEADGGMTMDHIILPKVHFEQLRDQARELLKPVPPSSVTLSAHPMGQPAPNNEPLTVPVSIHYNSLGVTRDEVA